MSGNYSNITDKVVITSRIQEQQRAFNAFYHSGVVLAVAGTLLNLWLLVAILTSREMRLPFRNKIICNILLALLLDSAVIIPVSADRIVNNRRSYGCAFLSVFVNMQLMQEFVSNWLVVMILAVFIAQIQDFNPTSRLTPKAVTLSSIGLLVLPWVASLTVVPIIVHLYRNSRLVITDCFLPAYDSFQVFKSIDTAVPIILAIVLVIVAAVLRYIRFSRGHLSGSMQAELISRGPEIDKIFAYVAAVVVVVICDIILLMLRLNPAQFYKYGYITMVRLFVISHVMSDVRVVLMPLPWLLLPDVRQRIKTWRPWYRPTPGIDVAMAYSRKEDI